jgi:ribonuclease D
VSAETPLSNVDLPFPRLAAEASTMEALLTEVAPQKIVAFDTESNSFHVYRERVCLLQLSTPSSDWVIDPLAVDVSALGVILTDGREVVFHGADYDVRCLKREYGWRFPLLFDTMAAARRLRKAGLGLSALVESHFGVRLSKQNQRSNWGQRPLTDEQVRYAALDTHFLLQLRENLLNELRVEGLEAQARQEFQRIAAVVPREKIFDPEGYRRLPAARELGPTGKVLLKALYVAREAKASEIDRPPFKVLGEHTLVEIARRFPKSAAELERIPGVTPQVMKRMGRLILAALEQARGTESEGATG